MLRRTALVAVLIGLIVCTAPGFVSTANGRTHFQMQMGFNLANSSFDSQAYDEAVISNNVLGGLMGGGAFGFTLPGQDLVALESGLYIQMRGGKTVVQPPGALDMELEWKLNYLTVPILARLPLGGKEFRTQTVEGRAEARAYTKAGLELGFLLTSSLVRDEGISVDINDHVASSDLGVLLAIGVELGLGRVSPLFELRYAHGLKDVHESDSVKIKNRVLSINFGVLF